MISRDGVAYLGLGREYISFFSTIPWLTRMLGCWCICLLLG